MSRTTSTFNFSRRKNKRFSLDELFPAKTKRAAREKKVLHVPRHTALDYVGEVIDGENCYISTQGGHIVVGQDHVLIKLPYGISANDIWRASLDSRTGQQRNSLSLNAKNYKRTVTQIYEPLLKAIGYNRVSALSEVRLVVQPPKSTKKYSEVTYPRFDIDNYPKLLIDSLKGLVFKDDNIFIVHQTVFAKPVQDGCVWLSCIVKKNPEEIQWLDHEVNFDWLAGRSASHHVATTKG